MSEEVGSTGKEPVTRPSRGADRGNALGARLALIGLAVAVACAAAAVLSGVGYRLGLWEFRSGFAIMRWAFFGALAAALISLAGLILGRGSRPAVLVMALLGVLIGLVTAYLPWNYKRTADSLPKIHDITTDVVSPPEFVAAASLRREGDHPVTYDGPEVAAQQQQAYADLAPLITKAPKAQVFDAASATLENMGLEITGRDPEHGRLEAVHTSLLYGFKDDLVVRIEETADGTKVDMRSKSRVGRSDIGMNAKRIRTFMAKLKAALPA
jgi:uncharacterized protein (DUF1499 family)